jgi:hypothetical protein
MDITSEKQQAHELIDRLDETQIVTVVRFLEFMMLDPASRSVAIATVEDEELSDETRQSIHRSEAWFQERGGKGIPMEEVLADFGLTLDDFPLDAEGHGSRG